MTTNYVNAGSTVDIVSPAGGTTKGFPVAINDLVVIANADTTKAGVSLGGWTSGVWNVPAAAGLKQGKKVGFLNGGLVDAGTANAVYCGKLMSDTVNGFADFMLLQ